MDSLTQPVTKAQKAVYNILLIEREPGDTLLIKEYLDESTYLPHTLKHVDHLPAALHALNHHTFDVILLDISISSAPPGHLLQAIRAVAPDTPIIFLVSMHREDLGSQAVRPDIEDYLVKENLNAAHLARSIRFAVERTWMLDQLQKARKLEHHLAYHDALTGLPNRRLLQDRLEQVLRRARRSERIIALLSLDIDGFKRINETLGHAIGDHILKVISQRLQTCIRKSDTVARQSGDEFVIILNEVNHERHVIPVAQKVMNTLALPIICGGQELYLTASLGISIYPGDGENAELLAKNSEIAMHRAKNQGKNTYQLYNLSMDAEAVHRLEMENSLHRAIEQNQLALHYQPLLNLASGRIESMEALLRWHHPTLGMVSPETFIPLAEETGLIEPLGEWVLHTACAQAKALTGKGQQQIKVAVNLSNTQFRNRNLQQLIFRALEKTGLEPHYLALEVTESSAMKDVDYTIATLQALQDAGIQVSIDDFGTGYSSLSYLKKLPIRQLKIDRSFLEGIPGDNENKSITSAIIFLAHNLGLNVVAEGVETREQLSFLRSMRCNEIQGFFFSRPLPFPELQHRLLEQAAPC